MQGPAGYTISSTLYQSGRTTVMRAVRDKDLRAVILKLLTDPYPQPRLIAGLRYEHDLLHRVAGEGLPEVLALETFDKSPVIVSSDRGGESLRRLLTTMTFDLRAKLEVATHVAAALARVHAAGVIHKDITPANVVWRPETGEVELIDFGSATRLTRTSPNPEVLQGTLPYIAPEQTGRMNRSVDYRSDLYSLGATLFHLFTGRAPFQAEDPLELIHAHIARPAPSLLDVQPDLPPVLATIVARLLSKAAEERYQSATALHADLAACLEQVVHTGACEGVELGRTDQPTRFTLPQRLYGREAEVALLLKAFERVSEGGRELLLVAGYSGIGKSSLVNELQRSIVARRGYFVSGKIDQLKHNIPYASLIQAMRELIRQLLGESPERRTSWRAELQEALGPNGRLILDVIPELEHLIGPQSAPPKLSPLEERNRFNLVMERFVRTFAAHEHPLVLFLDDLQWADPPTLNLIERFLTGTRTHHLLLIGAYRDNEVGPRHPLTTKLTDLREAGAAVGTLTLGPLEIDHVEQLLADALGEDSAALAEICQRKTHGNPFFLGRFLLDLHRQGWISFDPALQRWRWDLEAIDTADPVGDAVELLTRTILTLPEPTRRALSLAACMGSTFDTATLSLVHGCAPARTNEDLWPGLEAGILLPVGDTYRLLRHGDDSGELASVPYRFLHDRVQQAAYALLSAERREQVHRQVGELLLQRLSPEERAERLFEIADHLNRGASLLEDQPARDDLATINLEVGRRAKAAVAYEQALDSIKAGIELLGPGSWERAYDLTLALHVEGATAAYLSGDFTRMDGLVQTVRSRARTLLDQVPVCEVQVSALISQNRPAEAVSTALEVLALLGVRFPARPAKRHALLGLLNARRILLGKRIEDIADLPEMTDPSQLAAMRLLASISSAAYVGAPDLFPLIALKQVALSVTHGVTGLSAFALTTYGIISCGALGDIDRAYACGKTSLRLLDRFRAEDLECRTVYVYTVYLRPWKDHATLTWRDCPLVYQRGLETGDTEFAGWAAMMRVVHAYFTGKDLEAVDTEAAHYAEAIRNLQQETALHYTEIVWQAARNLREGAEDPGLLQGSVYEREAMLPVHEAGQDAFAVASVHFHELVLRYLFGAYRQAERSLREAEQRVESLTGLMHVPIFHQYAALTRLALCAGAGPLERARLLVRVALHRRKLALWARHAPKNHLHRLRLVEAETARVRGRIGAAVTAYEEAIAAAREHAYVQGEALANELAGRFFQARGNEIAGRTYLLEARHAWSRWGAQALVRRLDEQLPPTAAGLSSVVERSSTRTESVELLDFQTVMKASQAISSELVRERLLERMMAIILETAGAQRGHLVVEGPDGLRLEAVADPQGGYGDLGKELGQATGLSRAIVEQVLQSGKSVVLGDAPHQGDFTDDPYVLRAGPRSVLCAPILARGEVRGALYLENNLATHTFTPSRLKTISVLAAQAAISLENATLFTGLEQASRRLQRVNETLEAKVRERTAELEAKNQEVQATLDRLRHMQDTIIMQEKLASLGTLTAGIAHEIKNPLNFVNNFASLSVELSKELAEDLEAEAERLDPEVRERILETLRDLRLNAAKINEHGRRADRIIHGMLSHSRGDSGDLEETDITALLEDHVNLVYHSMRARGGKFEIERDYTARLQAEVSPQTIGRVFLNVLENAAHAVLARAKQERKGFVPQLRIATRDLGEQVEISVKDNGVGIPAEVRDRIFEPFFTTKPTGTGTGLGMSIVHDIVTTVHRGTITVESEVGEYTEVRIVLPRKATRIGDAVDGD